MTIIDKLIYREIKPHLKSIFAVLFLMLLVVGLEAIAPWPFKLLIDNVLGEEAVNAGHINGVLIASIKDPVIIGFLVVFLYFLINTLLSIFTYFRSVTLKRVTREIIFSFSKSAFSSVEFFNIGFYRKQSIGDYIYRLSYDVSALGEYIEDGVLPIITSLLYLIITTVIMFFINMKLTLFSLIALPFMTVGLYFFNKKIDTATAYSERWNSAVFSYVNQALSQLRIIQSFTQEEETAKKFNRRVRTSLTSDLKVYRYDFLLDLLVGVIIAVSYSVIIANGITSVRSGEITTGQLVVFIFYLDNLVNPVLSIIFATSILKQTQVKIARLREFFAKRSQVVDKGTITEMDKASIKFEHVSLLTAVGKPILKNITLTIPEQSFVALIGTSGSGKTSLISLISRLMDEPSSGDILIGARPITEYPVKSLRESISYMPQDIVLFNDTIYNNIAFGYEGATRRGVIEAAKLACAHDFILQHPQGYDFKVGEEGNFLSGGERQRILLARSFLKPAKIVILDEPLSFLDIETRSKVWKNIQSFKKGKTLIVVTNVLDVVLKADKIFVMDKGEIISKGNHEDLIKKSLHYQLLLRNA